jgi:aryl-alcohol dehydrogenase-like predicted oxidoreductase
MKYITLGRTGLRASVLSLGTGGPSRIGQNTHKNMKASQRVIREAIDLGVNLIDTAEGYDTEDLVACALEEVPRDKVILSTKKSTWTENDRILRPEDIIAGVEGSLKRLSTDYIDIYHLHALPPQLYKATCRQVVPTLLQLKQEGKIRFIGVTERFESDSGHAMLQKALADDCWDVVMVGFNMLNQSARDRVFPQIIQKNVGTQIMFAVRRALSRPERLREIIADLHERGKLDEDILDDPEPLAFLLREGGALSLPEAAYRFCRHEPGCHVILSGTGNIEHLRNNIEAIQKPDLPETDRKRLETIFRRVDDISGS